MIREKIHKTDIQKTIEKINKTNTWFFETVNKIDKPLARLTKKRRGKNPNKVRNEKGDVTTETTKIPKKKKKRKKKFLKNNRTALILCFYIRYRDDVS